MAFQNVNTVFVALCYLLLLLFQIANMIGPWPRRYNPFCLFAVHFVGSAHSKILGEKVQFDHFICYLSVQSMSGKYTGGYEEPFSDAMCDAMC